MAMLPPFSPSGGNLFEAMQPLGNSGLDPQLLAAQSMASPEEPPEEDRPIDKLTPNSDKHKKVLEKLNAMFNYSQTHMRQFHHRWNWQEQKIQAYISQPDYEEWVKQMQNNRGAAPEPTKIIIPYTYATLHAAATYIYTLLAGRRPIFPLMATRGTAADKARYMEAALQSNLEAEKGHDAIWQHVWDSLVYNLGPVRIGWTERYGKVLNILDGQRDFQEELKYAGNSIIPIDPYQFFPDPRVPLSECNVKGDFVFWVNNQSKMVLKDKEADGLIKWVDEAMEASNRDRTELGAVVDSSRRTRVGLNNTISPTPHDVVSFAPVREGTVRLVPKDWGLGDSDRSELWKFAFTSKQVMQAQPLGMVHDMHPIAVAEPTSFGHEFGSLALGDFINPFQDLISWLVNSRMENVRTTVNNQYIVDPNRIELQDLRAPAAGKVIRLKQSAIGTPVDQAIRQLDVRDVTQGHIGDIQMLRMLADASTGVNDNMRGIQSQGGRRSATEARMSMQAGASRLSQFGVRISGQSMGVIAKQMIMNIQQFMPQEMWVEMSGDEFGEQPGSNLFTPDMITGEFNYQVSDGTLPFDKMAMVEVWKEILFGIMQDPQLRQEFSVSKIFEHVAVLGGAKNISAFKNQMQPGMQLPAPGQPPAGAVPMGAAIPQLPSQ